MNLYTRLSRPNGLPWDLLVNYRLDDLNDFFSGEAGAPSRLVPEYLRKCDCFLDLMNKIALYSLGCLRADEYSTYLLPSKEGGNKEIILHFLSSDASGTLSIAARKVDIEGLFVKEGADMLSGVTMVTYHAPKGLSLTVTSVSKEMNQDGTVADVPEDVLCVNDYLILSVLRNLTCPSPEFLRRRVFLRKANGEGTSVVGMIPRQIGLADFRGSSMVVNDQSGMSLCTLEPGHRVQVPVMLLPYCPGNIYGAFDNTAIKWVHFGDLEGAITLYHSALENRIERFFEPKQEFLSLKEDVNVAEIHPITMESWV